MIRGINSPTNAPPRPTAPHQPLPGVTIARTSEPIRPQGRKHRARRAQNREPSGVMRRTADVPHTALRNLRRTVAAKTVENRGALKIINTRHRLCYLHSATSNHRLPLAYSVEKLRNRKFDAETWDISLVRYLCRHKPANRVFASYGDIVYVCSTAWNSLIVMPERQPSRE